APATRGTARPAPDGGPEAAVTSSQTGDGLPRRRRKRPMAIVPGSAPTPRATGRSDSEQAQVMGAFQRGTQSGRVTEPDRPDHAGRTSETPGASSEGHEVS
ncbi:ATP-binding protein, partial [Streptomyces sp. ICN988]|nr:ATP-binding protein [Streptomyces sp. ICN988]